MRSCESKIALAISRIVSPKACEAIQNAVSNAGISCERIKNHINEAIIRVTWIANDKGTRVKPLSKTGSDLIQAGKTVEWYLSNRPGMELADSQVSFGIYC